MQHFAPAAIGAALALSACATPQETCIRDARGELGAIAAQIRTAEGNIARGYAIHYQTVTFTYAGTCINGAGDHYPCERTNTRVDETPVTIDMAEERRKLAALQTRLTGARARADTSAAHCRVAYPE